ARTSLRAMADGDGRYLLNLAEEVAALKPAAPLDSVALVAAVQKRAPLYDKSREEHYNLISALHKSIRGSDPDAALYWLARMLAGGEQPLYIARRFVRAAVEDIGLADPQAVVQALAAKDVYEFLGSPEGGVLRPELYSRRHGPRKLLRAERYRLRTGNPQTAGVLGETAGTEERKITGHPDHCAGNANVTSTISYAHEDELWRSWLFATSRRT